MAKFYFLLNLDEVLNNTVIDPNDSYQMNKLVIPRHTLVNVAEHDFYDAVPLKSENCLTVEYKLFMCE